MYSHILKINYMHHGLVSHKIIQYRISNRVQVLAFQVQTKSNIPHTPQSTDLAHRKIYKRRGGG